MDFGGLLGLDGASSGNSGVVSSSLTSSELEPSRQWGLFGSTHFKHGRSAGPEEHEWRSLKVAKSNEASHTTSNKAASSILGSDSHTLFPEGGEQMLSFSSSKANAMLLSSDAILPYYHHSSSFPSAPSYEMNAAFISGNPNASMHEILARVRGSFTPTQWMELKQQFLIYKYIDANMPIPQNLLNSIRVDLNQSSGFSAFSAGSFKPNTLGWGSFHLGFSGNVDPEPGRCRRTDGKKWRCSRDAVADQKYCERHINRGRHRSRKHVEGQSGHAAKVIPPLSQSASAVSSGKSSICPSIAQKQMKSLQPNATDSSTAQYNRMLESKENGSYRACDSQGLSMLTAINTKPTNTLFPISKQHNAFEGVTTGTDFGLISTDSLPNLHSPQPHPLQLFNDAWPKDQSSRPSTITWAEEIQSDRTQLSISIPMASSDFSSSSSSPHPEKPSLSSLRLSNELSPIHMGLGVGIVVDEVNPRHASWVPISWEASLGGPLGEVLANNNTTPRDHSKSCCSSSSPTDVLKETTFGSLSSSTGSSPRVTSSLHEDLLGSTFVNPSTIPFRF